MHVTRQIGFVHGSWRPFHGIKSTKNKSTHLSTTHTALYSHGATLSHFTLRSRRRRHQSLATRASSSSDIPVTFVIIRKINYGETHTIVGNHPSLGNWKIRKALQMSWSDGDRWQSTIFLPKNSTIEFKCVRTGGDNDPEWEPGNNHRLFIDESSDITEVIVEMTWGEGLALQTITTPAMTNERHHDSSTLLSSDASAQSDGIDSDSYEKESQSPTSTAAASSSSLSSDSEDLPLPSRQWIGKDVVFMRSNQHSSEREGIWNTEGLEGPALHLVQGDESAGSWLGKLGNVKSLLVDAAHDMRPDLGALSHAYVYLTWVATGALPCVEQGGHRRPNHHANLGQTTFRTLEWVIGDRPGSIDAIIARRLHTRLPAFDEQFTQGTPLTRIRDIAHRNDIPHELKQEIKHTIQNKLHRNAGPEDLVATEALLARVTATPGEYSQGFLDQLKLFVAELKEFFNAGSLSDLLLAVQPAFDDANARIIDRFVAAKKAIDENSNSNNASPVREGESSRENSTAAAHDSTGTTTTTTTPTTVAAINSNAADCATSSSSTRSVVDENALMDALHSTTSVRALLASGLSSGLRNDAPDKALSMRQKWRLAEIKAEDYIFVLMSRFINKLEERGGAAYLAQGHDATWGLPLGALVIGLRHIGLSGFDPGECMALEKELASWQRLGSLSHPEEALRLRATLQRAVRLTESYCNALLDTLTEPARVLGQALGIRQERYEVFVEAEIRSHVVFQLSKLAGMMLKATGVIAGVTPWNVVVAGTAQGVLLAIPRLDPGCLEAAQGNDAVLLVESATGDEEVAALGKNLQGIILQHEIPHLSHLGVRARQEKVPFVTCEDRDAVDSALVDKGLLGKVVKVVARVDGVQILSGDGKVEEEESLIFAAGGGYDGGIKTPPGSTSAITPMSTPTEIKKAKILGYIPLESATIHTCGAKATACSKLSLLAHDCATALQTSGSADAAPVFEAPRGIVVPFGCMELLLQDDKNNRNAAVTLKDLIDQAETAARAFVSSSASPASSMEEIDRVCSDIDAAIGSLCVPDALLEGISRAFDPGSTVILRSSANVEDLQGLSGAGLYESIPNVDSSDNSMLRSALCSVWSSLFSRRAVLARAAARLPPGAACMAVLIQEQLAPELSFVLHTVHPLTKNESVLVAEVAPGMGETLASGTRGSGWMLEVERETGKVTTRSFANFSKAFMPASRNYTSGSKSSGNFTASESNESSGVTGAVSLRTVDYSEQELSWSEDVRQSLGKRLAIVGRLLEHEFGGEAQDVEGCLVDGRVFVVQSRPQP